MKTRSLAFAVLVACVCPCFQTPVAHAQGTTKEDPFTDIARQRFQEGVKLYDQKKYEDARAAFVQAYALKKHPAVLLNLAQSELRSNHPVDAARHFQTYLQENPGALPAERKVAEQGVAEARTKTGRVKTDVNLSGADVFIDDEVVGKSPLAEPIDVTPGTHKVEARLAGYPPVVTQVHAVLGQTAAISLKMDKAGGAAVVAPVPVPHPATAPPPPAAAPPQPRHDGQAPKQPKAAQPPPPPSPPPPPPSPAPVEEKKPDVALTTEGRQPFFVWVARDKVAWVTGGVTVVGLLGGIIFSVGSSSAGSNVDSLTARIRLTSSQDPDLLNYGGQNRQQNPCADPVPVTPGRNDYRNACTQLRDNLDAQDLDRKLAAVGWGMAIVGGAATVVAYVVRTKPKPKGESTSTALSTTTVVPLIGPSLSGLTIVGSF